MECDFFRRFTFCFVGCKPESKAKPYCSTSWMEQSWLCWTEFACFSMDFSVVFQRSYSYRKRLHIRAPVSRPSRNGRCPAQLSTASRGWPSAGDDEHGPDLVRCGNPLFIYHSQKQEVLICTTVFFPTFFSNVFACSSKFQHIS